MLEDVANVNTRMKSNRQNDQFAHGSAERRLNNGHGRRHTVLCKAYTADGDFRDWPNEQ